MEQNNQASGFSSAFGSFVSGIPVSQQNSSGANTNSQGFVSPASSFLSSANQTGPPIVNANSFSFQSSSGAGQSNTNSPLFGTVSPFGPFGSRIPDPQQNSSGVGQFNTYSQVFQPTGNPFSRPPTFIDPYYTSRDPFSSQPVENVDDFHDDEALPDQPAPTSLPDSSSSVHNNVVIETSTEFPAVAASDSNSSFAVLLGIRAPPLPVVESASENQRVPIDLVAVLDISGSMAGKKLSLLKFATKFVIDHMLPCDRLSIIVFSTRARRILPLRRMTENGRKDAESAVDSLLDEGSTNVVAGLNMGAQVLEQRRQRNPVSSLIFLSDGQDNTNGSDFLHLLSPSISSHSNQTIDGNQTRERFPVYSFGLGTDHDAVAMNAIADGSCGGTFSFVESAEMIPKSFARCIGGLFSVVAQDVRVTVSSASAGVEIKSIPSGRHRNEIVCRNKQGIIHVGDLFADEKKDFLIYLSVPVRSSASVDDHMDTSEDEAALSKTPLLDIHCYYCNAFADEIVKIDGPRIEIRRPISLSPADKAVDLKVDGQKNRVAVSESIAKAKEMADKGNLAGAKEVLTGSRDNLLASASAQAGAEMVNWLEAELKEITARMESMDSYERHGRAFMNAGLSAHGAQRASTRNYSCLQASACAFGASGSDLKFASFGAAGGAAYDTPMMASMQSKVQMPNLFEPAGPNQQVPKNPFR